jgi:transcriptional regulator with XRE-family HTH domain
VSVNQRLIMSSHMNYSEELAEIMRQATASRSQRQVAKEAQVSQGTIGNMLMGMVPSRDVITRVAQAIGVPVTSMLKAAGYEIVDTPTAVELALRATEDIPEQGKRQVLDFVECVKAHYENKPHEPLTAGDIIACLHPEFTKEMQDNVQQAKGSRKEV